MTFQIMTTKGAAVRTGVKILCVGPPGVGKTRMIKSLPSPFIISAEGGLLSLRDADIPYVEIRSMPDFYEVWNWVSTSKEARKFASFAIDSASEIAEICLGMHKASTKDGRMAYGGMAEQVGVIIKNFRNLQGPNVYFSAKQDMVKNDGGTPPVFAAPMMPGNQLGKALAFDFDEAFQAVRSSTPEGVKFTALRTRGSHEFDFAKDRSGSLPEWVYPEPGQDIPDLGKVIATIARG